MSWEVGEAGSFHMSNFRLKRTSWCRVMIKNPGEGNFFFRRGMSGNCSRKLRGNVKEKSGFVLEVSGKCSVNCPGNVQMFSAKVIRM